MPNQKALIPIADYDDACDAIREKLFEETTYLSSELGPKIRSIAAPGLNQFLDRTFDPYEIDLDALPEEYKTPWVRPDTWPNLDSIVMNPEEVYLTFKNNETSDFISVYVQTNGAAGTTYNVDIGSIVDGVFTPLVEQSTPTRATIFTKTYDSTLPEYVVVKLSVADGIYITQYGFGRIIGADNTTYISGYHNPCVERYSYLPHWIGTNSIGNVTVCSYTIVHEYHKGITNTCLNLNSFCHGEQQLRKVEFVNCDLSAVNNMSSMFSYDRILQSVDFRGTNLNNNTSNVNFNGMFYCCRGFKDIFMDSTVCLKASNVSSMFSGCTSIETLHLEWLDLSIVTTLQSFCDGLYNLKEVTFNQIPVASVTTVSSMFNNCWCILHITMPKITSNAITTCAKMFNSCYQLEEIDLNGMPTPNCTTFDGMFQYCYNLKDIKFDTFQPIKATTLYCMCYNCWSLETFDFGTNTTQHSAPVCTNVGYMFAECHSLKHFTLDGLNLQSIVGIHGFFSNDFQLEYVSIKGLNLLNCTSLTYLTVGSSTSYSPMFYQCYQLKEIHLDGMNPNKVSAFYYRTSATATNYGYIFFDSRYLDTITFNDVTSSTLTSLTWLGTNTEKTRLNLRIFEAKNLACTHASFSLGGLFDNAYNLISADFTGSILTKPTSITTMFSQCWSLKEAKGMNDFDYSACTSAYQVFYCCKSLKSVDFHSANFANVTRIDNFFGQCYSLEDADLANFNVGSTCTNVSSMFNSCFSLREIEFNSLVGSAVTNWSSMFVACRNLTSIHWPYINTAAAENFSSMFSGCWSLKDVSFANFTTLKVTTYANMFDSCRSIEELDLHQFTLPSTCTSTYYMFSNCWNVKRIDITGMTYGGVTTAAAMFYCCYSLLEVVMPQLSLNNCTNTSSMFASCFALRTLDVSHLSVNKVTNNSSMFGGCENLISLDMRQANWAALTTANSYWWPNTQTIRYFRPGKLYVAFNLSGINCLSHDNLLEIFTDLPTATSASTALKLGTDNLARLTTEERTIGKNWVVSA